MCPVPKHVNANRGDTESHSQLSRSCYIIIVRFKLYTSVISVWRSAPETQAHAQQWKPSRHDPDHPSGGARQAAKLTKLTLKFQRDGQLCAWSLSSLSLPGCCCRRELFEGLELQKTNRLWESLLCHDDVEILAANLITKECILSFMSMRDVNSRSAFLGLESSQFPFKSQLFRIYRDRTNMPLYIYVYIIYTYPWHSPLCTVAAFLGPLAWFHPSTWIRSICRSLRTVYLWRGWD